MTQSSFSRTARVAGSAPLGPIAHPLRDIDGELGLGPLPDRALRGPVPFCKVELCLNVVPDDQQRGVAAGHDIATRRAEANLDLEPIRLRVIDALDGLLRTLNHRADYSISLVLRFEQSAQAPWWAEFVGPSSKT